MSYALTSSLVVTCVRVARLLAVAAALLVHAGTAGAAPPPMNDLREKVIKTAQDEAESGGVWASEVVPGTTDRVGYERLILYFKVGRPGFYEKNQSLLRTRPAPGTPDPLVAAQSWCGVFVTYVYRNNGLMIGPWPVGGGSLSAMQDVVPVAGGYANVAPGDICYDNSKGNQHMGIVTEVLGGGKVKMVSGNATRGGVVEHESSTCQSFYTYKYMD